MSSMPHSRALQITRCKVHIVWLSWEDFAVSWRLRALLYNDSGILSPQGYLLERLGDVTSALSIYCDAADRANNELVAAILAGDLPMESLPIPAQTRLARAGSP